MAISVTYDKEALKKIQERIKKQFEIMKEKQPLLSKIATNLVQSADQNFREEGTDKKKWQPLSPFTLWIKKVRKGKRTTKPRILQDTGFLRQSIVPQVGEDYALAGTNVLYAVLHQEGGVSEPSTVEIKNPRYNPKGKYWDREGTIKGPQGGTYRKGKKEFTMNIKGGHKIPAREFLTIRELHKQRILDLARRWFQAKGV